MHRPSFRDLLLFLLDNREGVLSIDEAGVDFHHQVGVMDLQLQAGSPKAMYQDLQNRYLS